MKMKFYFVFALMLSASVCRGTPSVHWEWNNDDKVYYLGVTAPDGAWAGSGAITMTITPTQEAVLQNNFEWITLGWGLFLLETSRDTLINYDLFSDISNDGKFFQFVERSGPVNETDLMIPQTDDFFSNTVILAFGIGMPDRGDGIKIHWNGWIEFAFDGENVFIHNWAFADASGKGIVAGAIPEPATLLLTLSGVALLVFQRRRVTQKE